MSDRNPNIPTVEQQALEWTKTLPRANAILQEEFAAWIRGSPEHLSAFLKHKVLGTELQRLDQEHNIDVTSLLERGKVAAKVVPWPVTPAEDPAACEMPAALGGRRFAGRSVRWSRIAAGIAMLSLISSLPWWSETIGLDHPLVYATSIGQQKRILLRDGSTIELNTQTSVRVDISATARNVYLLGGEALFDVKHDAALPFRVHANGTLIEDLGTQFSVHRRADATNVSVIEGFVQVSAERRSPATSSASDSDLIPDVVVTTKEFEPLRQPERISAGEQASIVADGTLMQKRPLNIAQATAWRHGRVAFSGATLDEIVAEFNRYNVRKIRIHGDELRERRYTGVFDARDPESFIDYLREDRGIEIEDNKDGLILRHH